MIMLAVAIIAVVVEMMGSIVHRTGTLKKKTTQCFKSGESDDNAHNALMQLSSAVVARTIRMDMYMVVRLPAGTNQHVRQTENTQINDN